MAENKEPFTQVARALRKPRERSNGKLRPLGSPSNPFKFASLRLTFFFSKKLQRIGKFKEKETRREGGIGCHDAKINNE